MSRLGILFQASTRSLSRTAFKSLRATQLCPKCHNYDPPSRKFTSTTHRFSQPVDSPTFRSILDNPPVPVRVGKKRSIPGLIFLALMPLTAFALGTWQIYRLSWKSNLIAKFEDRLVRDPLPLPLFVDPSAINEFDYRRIWARGVFRHDLEMLLGPRIHDGKEGYLVITPLERSFTNPKTGEVEKSMVLISRGWIAKKYKSQKSRDAESLPTDEVTVEGLLREPYKKNMFTPDNNVEKGEWYFPDVRQMAEVSGSQAVWVEETMEGDLLESWRREGKGVPIGRATEVNLRNNHAQYIFTWYALAAATSVMLWMVVKKPPKDLTRRVRQNKEWS